MYAKATIMAIDEIVAAQTGQDPQPMRVCRRELLVGEPRTACDMAVGA